MCTKCDTLEADIQAEVLFASIERELILAESNAGESVAGAIRPLSPVERRAKMRFGEIEALEQSAAEKAAKLLAGNAQVYIMAVIGAIFGTADAVQPAAVVDAIESMNRAQPDDVLAEIADSQNAMSAILRQAYAGASEIVIGEARRQGVKKTPKPLTAEPDRFDLLAKAVALHPWTRLTSKLQADMMNPATLMKTALAEGDPILRADIEKALNDIPLDGAEDLARQTIHTAHGAGRLDAAETMQPEEIYSSELMDGATCDACAKVDGKDYATMADAKVEYETGGYGACKGGARCRGTLVFQYNALGIDAPVAKPPAPRKPAGPQPPRPELPDSIKNPLTPWAKKIIETKKALPEDLSKLGYRTELPDYDKLLAVERQRVFDEFGGDVAFIKKQAVEAQQRLDDWDALSQGLYRTYATTKWPADLLPLARKLGFSRQQPKTVMKLMQDGRYDLWVANMDAGSKVAQIEAALERLPEYVKKWQMKPKRIDDLKPDGTLADDVNKSLDAVLDAGKALDDELQARVTKKLKGTPNPYDEYEAISDRLSKLYGERATTPDDALFARLGEQVKKLEAERKAIVAKFGDYRAKKAVILADEAKALIADVRKVGGGKRSTYRAIDGHSAAIADAMEKAHQLYPDDWNDRLAALRPDVDLGGSARGYNAGAGKTIVLSPDSSSVGPGGTYGHVAVHEIGHSMEEAIPGLKAMEWALHWRRSEKIKRVDGTIELKPAFDIYGKDIGMGSELAHRDEWATDYTGKTYRSRGDAGALTSWEIFQTGVESLFEGSQYFDRKGTLGDDAEFRRFILGVLSVL